MKQTSIISTTSIDSSDAVIISAPYEKTASSRKGTKYGPSKIIECLDSKLEFFSRDYLTETCAQIAISVLPECDLANCTPEEALGVVQEACTAIVDKKKFPVLLGGEHSVSLGLLRALERQYKPQDVTILQIDAHCDLRDSDADYSSNPSRLAHSCVMRRSHELGYRLVQVGIRTYSSEERRYFMSNKDTIAVFEWGLGVAPSAQQVLEFVKTQHVYLSIDVDGFDPAHMPGTGTPVQGGLEWWYGLSLIRSLIQTHTLIGADVVEVSPMQDSVLTEYGAAQLVYDIISHKFAGNTALR